MSTDTTTNAFPLGFDVRFIEPARYAVDGYQVRRVTEEVATADTLTLAWRVATTDELATLRELKTDEGQVTVLASDDGGHIAVDTAGGSNTVTLTPPQRRQPLRIERTAHVERYEETLVEQRSEVWDVEVEFALGSDRTDTPSILEARAGTPFPQTFDMTFPRGDPPRWEFNTPYGTFVTGRVDAEVVGTGEGGVVRLELTTRLTSAQAHVFEAAYARVRGTRVVEVVDAPNEIRDETGGDMTVGVRPPTDQTVVDAGDYAVVEWDSTRITDRYQTVSMTLVGGS